MYRVKNNGKYGLFSLEGENILSPIYDEIQHLSNSVYVVRLDNKYGFYDRTKTEHLHFLYDGFEIGLDKYVIARLNNKYGLFNMSGTEILPLTYDQISLELLNKFCICVRADSIVKYIDRRNGKLLDCPVNKPICRHRLDLRVPARKRR